MSRIAQNHPPADGRTGFSLVEVVLALGLTAFALLTLLGLFGVGLRDVGDSQRKVEAANALNSILETRLAAPASERPHDALPALDLGRMPIKGTAYVNAAGARASAGEARFRLSYEIWPDSGSTPSPSARLVRLHLLLSWPADADLAKNADTSEVLTSAYVSL